VKPHTNLLNEILLSCPPNVRLFRNDVGLAELVDGRRLRYGLLPGSGDLIGFSTIRGVAVFTSVEAKVGRDQLRPMQETWRDNVTKAGGIAIVCRSSDECWKTYREQAVELPRH